MVILGGRMYTAREIANIIRCSPGFVYKHYKSLGGIKIGGLIRFPKLNLENSEKGDDSLQTEKVDV